MLCDLVLSVNTEDREKSTSEKSKKEINETTTKLQQKCFRQM